MNRSFIGLAAFGLATGTPWLAAQDQIIVNVDQLDEVFVDRNGSVQIDLSSLFALYDSPGPIATFQFSSAVPAGSRDLQIEFQTDPNNGSILTDAEGNPLLKEDGLALNLPTFERIDGTEYSHFYGYTLEELVFNQHSIQFQLLPAETPIAVANFITYANNGAYENTVIHRNEYLDQVFSLGVGLETFVNLPVIQAGGFQLDMETDSLLKETPSRAPIILERSSDNDIGTLAMARTNVADSATNEFFINLEDNSSRLGDFYAVIGRLANAGDVSILQDFATTPLFDLSHVYGSGRMTRLPLLVPEFDNADAFLVFDNVTISEGQTVGLSYAADFFDNDDEVSDSEAANREAFSLSIEESLLTIRREELTGIVTIEITASASGLDPQTALFTLVGFSQEALETFLFANPSTEGWMNTAWYGWIFADTFPYIFHPNHGTQFVGDTSEYPDFYFYDWDLDWIYTSESEYPNIFLYNSLQWVYYEKGSGTAGDGRSFYIYGSDGEEGIWVTEDDL